MSTESNSIPAKDNVVKGPKVFSVAIGMPTYEHRSIKNPVELDRAACLEQQLGNHPTDG